MNLTGWSSISDSLMKNKCWICQQTFQKGKLKKVFQLSHFIEKIENRNSNIDDNAPVFCNNINDCYNSYLSMTPTDSTEKATMLEKELLKKDIALWMSGLVCCSTEDCLKQFMIIVPNTIDDNHNNSTNTGTKERKIKKNSIFTFANDECGPNCKCDSPWKFELPVHRTNDTSKNSNDTSNSITDKFQNNDI